MAEAWVDQADGLRRLLADTTLQVVSLTSARPDPGRPWAVLNLAAALRLAGVGVLVVDAASGQPGALTQVRRPGHDLADVLAQRCDLASAILPGPEGIPVLPARTGVAGLGGPDPASRRLAHAVRALPGGIEVLLVNLPAAEEGTQLGTSLGVHEVVLTTTPEPEVITATYRLARRLAAETGCQTLRLLVTGAAGVAQAQRVHGNLAQTLARYAGVTLTLLGVMPADGSLRRAAASGRTLVAIEPAAPAAGSFRRMAANLLQSLSLGSGVSHTSLNLFADPAVPRGLAGDFQRG